MDMGVEGIVLSPGYSYDKAPDQNHFMGRARSRRLFRAILSNRKPDWKFNMSPLFLEFLMGDRNYECTPWGSPCYNIFGWQRPCYLLQDGYTETFKELLETTKWEEYGAASGNPKCANCMVSCGYEPSAVMDGFGSLKGFMGMVRGTFNTYPTRMRRACWTRAAAARARRGRAARGDQRMSAEAHEIHAGPGRDPRAGSRHRASEPGGLGSRAGRRGRPAQALEKAFDYRGDVTLTLKSGERIEAYVFNRQTGPPWRLLCAVLHPGAPEKRRVSYAEIARLEFSGKDRAAGKQWEDWVKKYKERKAAGEKGIALDPESLD
jgi:hypothetical protein